jgi:hypothetical protein
MGNLNAFENGEGMETISGGNELTVLKRDAV